MPAPVQRKYVPSAAEARRQQKRAAESAADTEKGHLDAARGRKRRRREGVGYRGIIEQARRRESMGEGITSLHGKKLVPTE